MDTQRGNKMKSQDICMKEALNTRECVFEKDK